MEVKKGLSIFKEKNDLTPAVKWKRGWGWREKKERLIAQVCAYYKGVIYRNKATDIV